MAYWNGSWRSWQPADGHVWHLEADFRSRWRSPRLCSRCSRRARAPAARLPERAPRHLRPARRRSRDRADRRPGRDQRLCREHPDRRHRHPMDDAQPPDRRRTRAAARRSRTFRNVRETVGGQSEPVQSEAADRRPAAAATHGRLRTGPPCRGTRRHPFRRRSRRHERRPGLCQHRNGGRPVRYRHDRAGSGPVPQAASLRPVAMQATPMELAPANTDAASAVTAPTVTAPTVTAPADGPAAPVIARSEPVQTATAVPADASAPGTSDTLTTPGADDTRR